MSHRAMRHNLSQMHMRQVPPRTGSMARGSTVSFKSYNIICRYTDILYELSMRALVTDKVLHALLRGR